MSMEMNERSSWGSGGSDLRRELRVLWAHRWLVVTTAAILIGLAAAYTFLRTPIYTATATVFIKPTGISSSDLAGADISKLISPETEVAIATSEEVALIAKEHLGSDATTETLLKHVSVNVPIGSQIMEVHYSDPMKQKAADGANAFADGLHGLPRGPSGRGRRRATEGDRDPDQRRPAGDHRNERATRTLPSPVRPRPGTRTPQLDSLEAQMGLLTAKQLETFGINTDPGDVVSPAIPPTAPSSPNHELDLALGLFLGLFAGVGLAFLKHRTDNRLRERQQLEVALGAPVLSMIPKVEGWRNRDEAKLITVTDPLSPAAEAYRVLRPVLLAAAAKRGVKVVMVLSPMAGEGKSTTAANLAVVFAQSGRSVALITADLRRPRSHEFFEVASEPGLSEFLGGTATLAEVERRVSAQVGGDLVIYPAGRLRAHPAELLQSRQMQRFLEDQRETFDFLILDCPPVLAVSDALPLIPLSDGVLFVADAESTTREQVSLARDRLLQMGANLLGAVINGLSGSSSGYYDDRYAYTYQPTTSPRTATGRGRSAPAASRSGAGPRDDHASLGRLGRARAAQWLDADRHRRRRRFRHRRDRARLAAWPLDERGDAPARRRRRGGVRVAGVRTVRAVRADDPRHARRARCVRRAWRRARSGRCHLRDLPVRRHDLAVRRADLPAGAGPDVRVAGRRVRGGRRVVGPGREESIGAIEDVIRFATLVVIVLVLNQLLTTERALKHLLVAVYVSLAIPALVGAYQVVTKTGYHVSASFSRVRGTFDHPNPFSIYLTMLIVMGVALVLKVQRRSVKLLLLGAIGVSGTFLLLTYTRSAWIATLAGLLVVAFYQGKRLVPIMGFAVVLVVLLVPSVAERFSDLSTETTQSGAAGNSLVWRFEYWQQALELSENPIVGAGLRTVQASTDVSKEPHNDFIRVYVETGPHRSVRLPLVPGLARAERAEIHPQHAITARTQPWRSGSPDVSPRSCC